MNTPFRFTGFDCIPRLDQYRNSDAPAIELIAADTQNNREHECMPGESVLVASVNIPDFAHLLGPDETFLKTYSGNEGILECLVGQGLVEQTPKRASLSYGCVAPVVKVLKERFPAPEGAQPQPSA